MHAIKYKKSRLDNGIRVVTEKIPYVRSVAIGIWVGAGSRYESCDLGGISHFIEHLLFKGTQKRNAKEIAEALDSVGGYLNAFTSKEYTCFYARVLDEHIDLALDVLSDMVLNSKLNEKDIEKERQVIIEEIKIYEDTPDEMIHDVFCQTIWQDHPLGRPVLGTEDSLNSITRNDLLNYLNQFYIPENIVIAITGNVEHDEIFEKISIFFNHLENKKLNKKTTKPKDKSRIYNYFKDTSQMQICLGTRGLGQSHPKLYELLILNNILGGGLSSRLVQKIREERGLSYSVFSYHSSFSDTGLFNIYAGTRPENYQEVISLILEEISNIYEKGITEKELINTKEQLKGNLFLGLESISSRMTRLGRSELCLNKIKSPEEVIKNIVKVTREDIYNLVKTLFKKDSFSLATIGPLKNTNEKNWLSKYLI